MAWTNDQKVQLFENFWQNETSHCPTDNAKLETNFQKFLGGNYVLIASCPRCSEMMQMQRADDPKKDEFRVWTEDEKSRASFGQDIFCAAD